MILFILVCEEFQRPLDRVRKFFGVVRKVYDAVSIAGPPGPVTISVD